MPARGHIAWMVGEPATKTDFGVFAMNMCKLVRGFGAIVALGLALALLGQSASAAVYTWDAGISGGTSDGGGNWATTAANWWNGASNVDWTATGVDTAVFGNGNAGNYTATISSTSTTVYVGAIQFNAGSNYTINAFNGPAGTGIFLGATSQQYLLGSGANGTGAAGIYDNATGVSAINTPIITIGPQTWSVASGGTLQIGTYVENDYYSGNNVGGDQGYPGMGNITTTGPGTIQITNGGITSAMILYGTINAMSGTLSLSEPWNEGNGDGWGVLVGPKATVNLSNATAGFASKTYPADGILDGYGIINVNNTGSGIAGGWVSLYNGHSQGESSTSFLPQVIFTGTLNINSGVFSTNGTPAEVLGSATVNISSSGVLSMHSANYGWTIGSLNGSGTVANTSGDTATEPTYVLTVGAANLSGSFTGMIAGNNTTGGTTAASDGTIQAGYLALTKIGSGQQSFSGLNTYTGLTTVAGGQLLLDFSAASAPASNILFNNSGTLGVVSLSGGTLGLNAGSSGSKTQSVASIAVVAGGLNVYNTGGNMTLTAGSLTSVAGGMMLVNLATGAGNNTLTITNTTTISPSSTGVIGSVAVTDAGGTGFGMLSGNNIVRNTTTTPLASSGNSAGTDYTTTPTDPAYSSGTLTMTGAAAANSLAINAASNGAINLGGNTLSLTSSGLLMYGSGNYTISNGQLGASGAGVILNQLGPGALTIASSISGGAGTFSVGGGGSVFLTGSSGYTGGTYIGNGLLNITSSAAIGTGALTFNGNGTLQMGANNIALANAVSIPNAAVNATFDTQSFSTTASGLISGAGGLVKNGPGTLVLGNNNNTFTGGVTINGGVLSCGSLSQSGYPTSTTPSSLGEGMSITFNGGTLLYTGSLYAGTTGGTQSSGVGIDAGASYTAGNDYLVTLLGGGGTMECPNGGIVLTQTLAGSGNLTIENPGLSSPSLATMLNHAVYYSSQYRNASVDFTGNIIVNNNGALEVRQNGPNQLGNASSIQVGPNGVFICEADAYLQYTEATDAPGEFMIPFTLNGGSMGVGNPVTTFYGPVIVNSGTTNYIGTIVSGETGSMTLSGNLQGSGTLVTTGTGGATSLNGVTLSGSNSGFSGVYVSTSGYTAFTSPNAGSPNATWVANGVGFLAEMPVANFAGGGTISMGALTGSSGTLDNTIASSTATFSVGALNTNTTFGGVITNGAGTTALLKVGSGSFTLSGANTYNGATTVSGGSLTFNGNSLISGNNAIMVQNGVLNISSGTFNTGTSGFYVGTTGVGTVNMSGGSIGFSGDNLQFLIGNGANGTFNFSGGIITGNTTSINSRGVMLGVNAGTALNPVLATFNLSGNAYLNMPNSELAVGRNDSAQSYTTDTYSQTGGTAVVQYLSVGGAAGATGDIASFSVTGGNFSAQSFQTLSAGSAGSASITIGGNAQVTLPPSPGGVGATSTVTLTMNGGTLTTNGSSASFFNGVTFAYAGSNGANFNIPAGQSVTVTQGFQDLSGQFGTLSLAGNGTLVLAGSNTYSGATTINAGNMVLNFAASTAPVSNIIYSGSNTSSLTFGPGSSFGGGSLIIQGSAGAGNSQQFSGLTVNSNTAVSTISVSSGASGAASLSLGPIGYTSGFMVFSLPANGSIATTNATGVLGPWATISGGGFAYVSGGTITSAPISAYNTPVSVLGGSIPSGSTNSVVIVDGGTSGPVTLGSPTTIISTLVQSATGNAATISMSGGTLQAAAIMAPNGAQPLTIGSSPGDGTLTAATAGGALALYSGGAPSGPGLTVNSVIADNTSPSSLYTFGPGVTALASANTYSGPTTISGGSLMIIGTGSLGNGTYASSIFNNGSLVFGTSIPQTLSGVMSGNGSLVSLGPATLTLSNAGNTFNGGVTISGGIVSVNSLSVGGTNASALGEGPSNASGQSITFNSGMLTYTGAATVGTASPAGNATSFNPLITLLAGGGTLNESGGAIGFTGSLSGAGNLTIYDGSGTNQVWFETATTNGSSGFTGNIIIGAGGRVQQRTSATAPFGAAASITVDAGGALQADTGTTNPSTLPNNLVMNGGTLQLQNPGLMTYTGSVTVGSGFNSTFWTSGTTSQINLSGNLMGSGSATELGTPVVMLGGNNGSFTGTWISTGPGATTFTNAAAGSSGALWFTSGGAYSANVAGGGTINMGALSGTAGTLNNITASTLSTFSVGALGTNTTFGGVLANGSGTVGLTKVGGGVFTLSGASNSYTGPTTISGGTLQEVLTNTAPWPSGTVTGSAGAALAISYANSSQVYSAPVSGGIDLITAGTGTLTLASNPSYTGRTVVAQGTLMLSPTSIGVSGFGGTSLNIAGSATGWAVNTSGSAAYTTLSNPINNNVLTLTDSHNNEARSAWDLTQVLPVNGFTANFTYAPSSGSATADGMTLVFQNASSGTAALGGGGGQWGYETSVSPSVGIMLNLFNNVSQTGYMIDGGTGAALATSTSAFFHTGVPLSVSLTYNAQEQLLAWTISNSTSSLSDSQPGVNMASILGSSTAYIGFTGATGAQAATQTISNFTYTPDPSSLPTGTPLVLAAGAAFDLAGQSQTIGSLSGAGTLTNSLAASTPLLTVGLDNSSQTFSGILQDGAGTLSVNKIGSGMWTLAGNNTYSGNTTVSGGTLQLGNGGSTGSLGSGGLTMGNAWLSFNRSDAGLIFSLPITGGTVSQDGTGTTTLTANNTYSGGTFINQGYLAVGNGGNTGTLGSGPIAIANNANLIFNRSDAFFTVANAISGSGNVFQNGSGTVTLTGPQTYTGATTVTNGNLYINGANASSSISVLGGATLGGTGTASVATATLQDTASLEAGQGGAGRLTLAGLNFQTVTGNNVNISNISQYQSAAAINVTGANGLYTQGPASSITINLGGAAPTNFTPQTVQLIQYSGSIQGTGTSVFALNDAAYGARFVVVGGGLNFSTPGYIDLVYYNDYPLWTGAVNGDWFTSTSTTSAVATNWVLGASPSTPTNFIRNDSPVFSDSAANTLVNITDPNGVYPTLVTFSNNVLSYTLTSTNGYGIQGSGALVMNGSGAVSIYTTNGYFGGTTINAGRLNIGNMYALGSANNGATLTINGGSIDNVTGGPLTTDNYPINWGTAPGNGNFTFVGSNPLDLGSGNVTLGSSTAGVKVSGSTLEIDGVIGDNGMGYGFTQSGAGLLLLTASNTYLGPTVVNGGTLQIGNGGSGAYIGSTSGVSLAANTMLLFNLSDSQTYSLTISGSGGVMQMGSGLLALANSNTYTGGTTVNGGTLQLNAGGPSGTLAPNSTVTVNTGATLLLNASNALGTSGSSTILTVNSGGLVFANSGYRVPLWNTVNITGGTLASAAGNGDGNGNYSLAGQVNATSDGFGNPAVISATQVSLVANTVLNVTRGSAAQPADLIVSSVISSLPSGNGLTIEGNGFTQFTGANTYNGGTLVLGGTLQLAGLNPTLGASTGGLTVAAGALVDMNGFSLSVGALNGGGLIDNVQGNGSVSLTIGNGGANGSFSGTIQNTSGYTTLVKTGAGTQFLSGTNTYSGPTYINGGVLNFGSSSSLGSSPNINFGGGTLQWATGNTVDISSFIAPIPSGISAGIDTNGNSVVFNSSLSGAGGLTKAGAGMLTLAAPNTYTGPTSITGGSLNLDNPLAVQYSTVNVEAGSLTFAAGITSPTLGGLAGTGNIALATAAAEAVTLNLGSNNQSTTYAGLLSGAGGLTKTGSGTLTLNTPNYTGATDISGGVLQVRNDTIGIKVGGTVTVADGPGGAVTRNWNNLSGASPSGSNLFNDLGLVTSASMNTSVTSGTFAIAGITDPLLANYIFKSGSGTAAGVITVNLAGIPYGNYSVYVFSQDATAGHDSTLNVGSSTYYFSAGSLNSFVQVTNSNSASYPIGNYAVATGLTGASQTLTISSTTDTGFSGFEIVNTTNSLSASPVTISNGSTLDMTGGMQTIAALSSTDGLGSKVLLGNGLLTVGYSANTTFDGVISGSGGSLVKQGAGSLTFTGSNTYTGLTTVSGGSLQLGDGVATNGSVAGNIALANNSAIVFANPSTQLYQGVISGTGSFIKNGAGTLQLTANHTYSGPTIINAGTVQLGYGANLPVTTSGFGANTTGGTMTYPAIVTNGSITTNGTWTFNSGTYGEEFLTTPVKSGSLTLTDAVGDYNLASGSGCCEARSAFYNTAVPVNASFRATFTYTPGNVTAAGFGPWARNDENGFAFVLAKSGGTSLGGYARGFGVGPDVALPAYNNTPIANSAEIGYDVFQNNGGTIYGSTTGAATGFNINGGTQNTTDSIFGGNNYVPGDPISMTVSYNALTNVLTWSGTDSGQSLTFSETASANLQSITGGTSAFVGFTAGSAYYGASQVISNFNFSTTNLNGTLPSTTPLSIAAGGTLDLFGGNQTVASLSGAGVVTNTYGNTISTLTVGPGAPGSATNFSGTLQNGAGTLALVLNGPGELTLGGANAYSGGTTISGGSLQLGNSSALGTGALAANGGTLDLAGFSITVPSFSGAAGVVTNSGSGQLATLTVDQSIVTSFGGTIADGAGQTALNLTGPGTLVLSGTNTYSGGTFVQNGTLIVDSPSALADGSSLTVGQGASAIFAPASAGAAAPGLAAVPEPGALALLVVALSGAALYCRFRRPRALRVG
jgi:fibronectin-binding autotransporter adhesin